MESFLSEQKLFVKSELFSSTNSSSLYDKTLFRIPFLFLEEPLLNLQDLRLFYLKTLAGWERQKKFVVVKDNEG